MWRFFILSLLFFSSVLSQRFKKLYTPFRDLRFQQEASFSPRSVATRNDFRFDKAGECPRRALRKPCINELWFTFCNSDYDCLGHQKCCMYGCGLERRCMEAVNIPNGCKYNGIKYEETSVFPSKDGCNECMCDRGKVQCTKRKCLSCLYDGIWYTPQYHFKAVDGCNLCRCLPTGRVECTQENCGKTKRRCDLPLERGLCRDRLPRWHFNVEQEKCEMFEYSGCEGNSNNFLTLRECVEECEM
ncbi:WAP four-disulfide core domain protein 8-like [Saccostrea echinata]|uniref:WAP four-disulfide core domain protein 8-like n=1 Tax=Saccostrea echinata TaxID=191078 RepID=UPI002A82335A|nr:WAP four-disulfide core domain protein 8-like [Saccostrea echinata]